MIRWLAVLAAAGCTDSTGPHLDAVMPTSARASAIVTLSGRHLCGAAGDCATAGGQVQIGLSPPTVAATIVSYADASAQIQIPTVTPPGATALVVTVNDRASNALSFEVLP
jgi:hypothetical protein